MTESLILITDFPVYIGDKRKMIESTEKIFTQFIWTDSDGTTHRTHPEQCENKEKAESFSKMSCKNHLKEYPKDLIRYEVYSLKTVRKILSSNQFRNVQVDFSV